LKNLVLELAKLDFILIHFIYRFTFTGIRTKCFCTYFLDLL